VFAEHLCVSMEFFGYLREVGVLNIAVDHNSSHEISIGGSDRSGYIPSSGYKYGSLGVRGSEDNG
jgi:hypothetical protein